MAPQTVNTMPSATLDAIVASDVGRPVAIGVTEADAADDAALFADLAEVGVDYDTVVADLEQAGVAVLHRRLGVAPAAGGRRPEQRPAEDG